MSGERTPTIISIVCLLLAGCASTPAGGVLTVTGVPPATTEGRATGQAASPVALEADAQADVRTPASTLQPQATVDFPDVPLSPAGPWLVFLAGSEDHGLQYLWAVNDDGTGLTRLVDEPVITFDVRPGSSVLDGATIAYIIENRDEERDYKLKLLALPSGETMTVTSLLGHTIELDDEGVWNLREAIDYNGLQWSPGGSLLAFVGALNGPSVDVYTYDFVGGAITRLSDHPSNASSLYWSPDGRYLLYHEFDYVGMGGPGFSDSWVTKADGTGTSRLNEEGDTNDVYYESWISSTEIILVNQPHEESENDDIRIVDLETGENTVILQESFTDWDFSTGHNTWLLTTSYNPEPEAPLVMYRQGQRLEIPGHEIQYVRWLNTQEVFLGQAHTGHVYTIALDGTTTELQMGDNWNILRWPQSLLISPDEQTWAWYIPAGQAGLSELYIGKPLAEPTMILTTDPHLYENAGPIHQDSLHGITWSPDSQRLILLTYQGLHTLERSNLELVRTTDAVRGFWPYEWDATWIP